MIANYIDIMFWKYVEKKLQFKIIVLVVVVFLFNDTVETPAK